MSEEGHSGLMSGPVTAPEQGAAETGRPAPGAPCLEIDDDREATVGGLRVRRALPRRGRRTVGAWCFADHMGPADVDADSGLDIGPHPHIGLQTVTWLVDGQALHRDSLGSEQVIAPGQLNLRTAGSGVSHAEESTGTYRGRLQGVQLWLAQPQATRQGPPAFEHHAELPQLELPGTIATVLLGSIAGTASPARADTPVVGADLALLGPAVVPLRPDFEHGLLVLDGVVGVDDQVVRPGRFAYLGRGRDELALQVDGAASALLLGGAPFEEPIVMWWNFVGRSRTDIDTAYDDWRRGTDRFGRVATALPRIPAAPPPWQRAG